MHTITSAHRQRNGSALDRRDFLRIGSLGGLSLPWLLEQQAALAASSPVIKGRSVILLFLSGGPSQFETFDPKPDEPAEIRHTQFAHNAGGREYKINDGKGRIVREILG